MTTPLSLQDARGSTSMNRLARLLDVGPERVWRWEKGKAVMPPAFIVATGSVLSLSRDQVLGLLHWAASVDGERRTTRSRSRKSDTAAPFTSPQEVA